MPELHSHNFIADAEPVPLGSSFTEEQEEEHQAEKEEERITLVEDVNFETNPSNLVDLSEEVIRKKRP